MTLIAPISDAQVEAKAPVDDLLMSSIQQDLEDLDDRLDTSKSFDYEFKINGPLSNYPVGARIRLDGALMARAQTFTQCRLYMENPGNSGSLIADVRKYQTPNTRILSILRQYNQAIQSISQVAPNISTQSISRAATQIATQSIARWKSTINISSIVLLGNNLVRVNLATTLDSDYMVGDSVTFASCTNAGNNAQFNLVKINDDGGNNVIITNASAVAELTSPGNMVLDAWTYNFTNPVDATHFVVGDQILFASHTTTGNNGNLIAYAVNSGGNNIIVKNSSGAAQAGVAGTVDTYLWKYNYSSAVPSDFVLGEAVIMSGHTNSNNDGTQLPIRGVNSSGNNLVIFNTLGVAQGSAAGNANTNRWAFALPTDPSGSFNVGDTMVSTGTTDPGNSNSFLVVQINRLSSDNLIVQNVAGTTQSGAVGELTHSRMIVAFPADESAIYTTDSRIETTNMIDLANSGLFKVLQVNRGGGSNFNVVIDNISGVEQSSPAGRIKMESKSIFVNMPTLTLPTTTRDAANRHMQFVTKTAGGGDFSASATVLAGDILAAELVSVPLGAPSDVVIQIV